MRRPARRLRIAAWLLVSLTALGCGIFDGPPPPEPLTPEYPIIAAYLDDGHPSVLLQQCSFHHVFWITAFERPPAPPFSPGVLQSTVDPGSWITMNSKGTALPSQVRLLEPPPGWYETALAVPRLTEFRDGPTYTVTLTSADIDASGNVLPSAVDNVVAALDFTMADLRSLTGDEVWAQPSERDPGRPTSRAAFKDDAAASCSASPSPSGT